MMPSRHRVLSAGLLPLVAAVTLGLAPTGPAQAVATTIDCGAGPVALGGPDTGPYTLVGACGTVSIGGNDLVVTMGSVQTLVLDGTGNQVRVGAVATAQVEGVDHQVTAERIDALRLSGSGTSLTADRAGDVRVSGTDDTVRVTRADRVRLQGSGNRARFTRLPRLTVVGTDNTVRVTSGRTTVSVSGVDNRVSVKQRR